MFPAWRLKLREARLALGAGRWDAAAELLVSPSLCEFRQAQELSHDLATRLVDRADARIAQGQSAAGWNDYQQAARLGADEAQLDRFCRKQTEARLAAAVAQLAVGKTQDALESLDKMEKRNLGGSQRKAWQGIASEVGRAVERAAHGDYSTAIRGLEELLPRLTSEARGVAGKVEAGAVEKRIDELLQRFRQGQPRVQLLAAELHAAIARQDWPASLAAADSLLELSPQHAAARQARAKAWQAVGMEATLPYKHRLPWPRRSPAAALSVDNRQARSRRSTGESMARRKLISSQESRSRSAGDTVNDASADRRRLIAWIDSVGAYLLCLDDEIVLGQPSEPGGVDVPILADLSRRHGVIRRANGAYLLTPVHAVKIDGRTITEATLLKDSATIQLGDSVKLLFRKPHALSASAVLTIQSRHKTDPAVDGIVLMAESCIFGPQSHCHVPCRRWSSDVVLFRRGEELLCRSSLPLEVDGEPCAAPAAIRPGCRVENDEFRVSFEPLG